MVRRAFGRYWNAAAFLLRYAGSSPADAGSLSDNVLDRWIRSELNGAVREVTAALERIDAAAAGRRITVFTTDLSRWYLRRSRHRFLAGADRAAALATLSACLGVLTRLMAPFAPFLTDYVWHLIRPAGSVESVHLAPWPDVRPALIDRDLGEQMALARRACGLGRAARASAGIGLRQPLSRALVWSGERDLDPALLALIADELNVVIADQIARQPRDVPGGWVVAARSGIAVAIDQRVTADLAIAGLAHQLARRVQDARKKYGLVPGAPVELWWRAADPGVAAALDSQRTVIMSATGASRAGSLPHDAAAPARELADVLPGITIWLRPEPVS